MCGCSPGYLLLIGESHGRTTFLGIGASQRDYWKISIFCHLSIGSAVMCDGLPLTTTLTNLCQNNADI
jgi:hypothetical protein